MKNVEIKEIIQALKQEFPKYRNPVVTEISFRNDPFQVLVSCLLSLRTKDQVTSEASYKLFSIVKTPEDLLKLPVKEIEELIYPVGFYKTKAKRLKEIAKILIEKYNSSVPDEIDELLKLKGVGRKTANLVMGLGFRKPAICVDTHVHRISNRFGYVKTKNPHETEFALRKKLPKEHWIIYNDLLVTWGQNVCVPINPKCSICIIRKYCNRTGVRRSR